MIEFYVMNLDLIKTSEIAPQTLNRPSGPSQEPQEPYQGTWGGFVAPLKHFYTSGPGDVNQRHHESP